MRFNQHLKSADLSGKSDPYCVFACGRWDSGKKLHKSYVRYSLDCNVEAHLVERVKGGQEVQS
jgi:hypothetical protein